MVVNRVLDPASKLATARALSPVRRDNQDEDVASIRMRMPPGS
jgi:hypothetical protein